MREKDPIDERFEALYDAEVTPPRAVRDALAHQLGWDPGSKGAIGWRNWLMIAAGIALTISSAAYLGLHHMADPEASPVAQNAAVEAPDPLTKQVDQATSLAGDTETTTKSPAHIDEEGSRTENTATLTQPTDRTNNAAQPTQTSSSASSDGPSLAAQGSRNDATVTQRSSNVPSAKHSTSPLSDSPSPNTALTSNTTDGSTVSPSANAGIDAIDQAAPRSMAVDVPRLAGRGPVAREMEPGTPERGRLVAPYVLPAGQWWIGAYAGLGQLKGERRGSDQTALNDAERWHGSTQWGLSVGRTWRSGWSLSAGAGLALDRSTFSFEERSLETFTDVDTNWTETLYNNNQDVIYSWSIDTVSSVRPGPSRNTHARNLYGAIHVPLTLAWHGHVRRWRYGAFGGVTAWIPTQREGKSLKQEVADGELRVVDLADQRLDQNHGPRLNAHLGASLGFMITEHISAYAEPQYYTPLSAFGSEGALWMRGHIIQFRLQHEFGSRLR